MIEGKFRLDMYKTDVLVYIGIPDKGWEVKDKSLQFVADDIIDSWHNRSWGGHTATIEHGETFETKIVIWCGFHELSTLAHECVHAVQRVNELHNIKDVDRETEALVYEHVFSEAYKFGKPTDWAKRKGKPDYVT